MLSITSENVKFCLHLSVCKIIVIIRGLVGYSIHTDIYVKRVNTIFERKKEIHLFSKNALH